jgi:hypothetical protein
MWGVRWQGRDSADEMQLLGHPPEVGNSICWMAKIERIGY